MSQVISLMRAVKIRLYERPTDDVEVVCAIDFQRQVGRIVHNCPTSSDRHQMSLHLYSKIGSCEALTMAKSEVMNRSIFIHYRHPVIY